MIEPVGVVSIKQTFEYRVSAKSLEKVVLEIAKVWVFSTKQKVVLLEHFVQTKADVN